MAVIHDTYRFNCQSFANAAIALLNQAQGRPGAAYSLLRTAGMHVVNSNKWVQRVLDSYGGWDERSIDQELPQQWAGDPADVSFWLSVLLYKHMQALELASTYGLHNLWHTMEETLEYGGWDDADRSLVVRGHDFGVFFDRYVKNNLQLDAVISEVRPFFELIRPASASGIAGWLEASEVASLQRRVLAEKNHLQSMAKNTDAGDAIQRAVDMLSTAAAQETAICLIVSG